MKKSNTIANISVKAANPEPKVLMKLNFKNFKLLIIFKIKKQPQPNLLEIDNDFTDFVSHAAEPIKPTLNDLVSFDDFG